jgi:hypothetical protein
LDICIYMRFFFGLFVYACGCVSLYMAMAAQIGHGKGGWSLGCVYVYVYIYVCVYICICIYSISLFLVSVCMCETFLMLTSTYTFIQQHRLSSTSATGDRVFELVCHLFLRPAPDQQPTSSSLKTWLGRPWSAGQRRGSLAHTLLQALDPHVVTNYSQWDSRHSLAMLCVRSGATQLQSRKDVGTSSTSSDKERHRPRAHTRTHCCARASLKVVETKDGAAVALTLANIHNHHTGKLYTHTTGMPDQVKLKLLDLFRNNVFGKKARQALNAFDFPRLPSMNKVKELQAEFLYETYGSHITAELWDRIVAWEENYNNTHGRDGGVCRVLLPGFLKDMEVDMEGEEMDLGEAEEVSTEKQTAEEKKEATTRDKEYGFAIALLTPLAFRVHHYCAQSGEVVGMDGVHNLCTDRHVETTTLMTMTPAGALPCGYIINNLSSNAGFAEAVKALRDILPPNAFFHRGNFTGMCVCVCLVVGRDKQRGA